MWLHAVLLVLLMLTGAPDAGAEEWPPRPRLEDYQEYAVFLQAMTAYRQSLALMQVQPPLTITITAPRSVTLTELAPTAPEMTDWLSEDAPPPLRITGPEDMALAVEQAKAFVHPVYPARLRYNRTTSFSFPLGQATNETLGASIVTSALLGLAPGTTAGSAWLDNLYGDELLSQASAGTQVERRLDQAHRPFGGDQPWMPVQAIFGHRLEMSEGTFESYRR